MHTLCELRCSCTIHITTEPDAAQQRYISCSAFQLRSIVECIKWMVPIPVDFKTRLRCHCVSFRAKLEEGGRSGVGVGAVPCPALPRPALSRPLPHSSMHESRIGLVATKHV